MFKLRIFKTGTRLLYRVSPWMRLPYIFLIGILCWGLATSPQAFSWLAAVIMMLCIVGSLYVESWEFNNSAGTVISSFGIYPFVKRRRFLYSEISALHIRHFTKGILPERNTAQEKHGSNAEEDKKRRRGQKRMLSFSIELADGSSGGSRDIAIEIIEESKSGGRTENEAAIIAAYCGFSLDADRPGDTGPRLSIRDIPTGFWKR